MKPERSKIKSDILLRVRLLYVLFILAGGVVLVRLVWVQLFSAEVAYNADRLSSRIFTEEVIPAQRGSILSRDGEPLATSIFRYQAAFDFASPGLDSLRTFREQADSLSKLLAAFFGDRPASEYARMFREEHARRYRLVNPRDTQYLRSEGWLSRMLDRLRGEEYVTRRIYDTIRDHTPVAVFPREVDYAEWEVLRRYPLLNWNMGMVYRLVERDERIYPQGELARRTIGLTGDKGNYGIEEAYRAELAGRDGRAVRQRIARGFYGRVAGAGHEDPEDGYDVVTTLDLDLQDVADKALRQQLERQNALWGTTIVMETRTGEILALANLGRNADGSFAERENYALSRSMEPGSTFKLATMLTLLDDARMPVTTVYDTHNGDPVKIGPARNIRDSHRGDREIDFRRAVASSSNVYFAEAVWDRYGITGRKQRYSDYLRDELHLGETVGLERLGERAPSITSDWKVPDPGVMLVKMAYGYRVRLTPIQMITFYNAVANEGRMISPVLVRELRRGDRVEERFESRTISSSVCSRQTLRIVRECLQAVCTEGTASAFFRDTTRVRVAAKTGTAQITDARSREGRYYLGSMVAFFPADAPRYTVLTTIETRAQAGKAYYGGPLAGPVVKRMVDYIYNRGHDWYGRVGGDGPRRYPERVKGGDIAQIRRVADRLSPRASFDSRTGWGRAAVDSLSNVAITSLPDDRGVMPDVRGMGLKDALFVLESRGLRVRFSGQGAVVRQSIAAGTRIRPGAAVVITLD
ncbi:MULTISPECIES: penicillin-binding protein [Alistipes]|uniref:penicillin-binding protein n=1 Tax=Alistipes TaxID=239759 RepID=UPI001B3A11E9|nr:MULTISPECIES: penicillin-binding transpeptidase domain-containing protein [Alistipes]MBQ4904202.1 transpeptidase family protein [Alistipes sp. Marseille-P2263]MBS5643319.1 transpeptidase family protein [Alistipes sp.]MCI2258196.1 PASTA domain-containing protein [Alistipes dispar]HJC18579.1 PASTA domain-containing protein [Candidatus Alistipes stercoripullorum]